jgi:transposase
MTAKASGTIERPGRNVAAKSGLNRSILDAGWKQFTSILVAKAESAGRGARNIAARAGQGSGQASAA